MLLPKELFLKVCQDPKELEELGEDRNVGEATNSVEKEVGELMEDKDQGTKRNYKSNVNMENMIIFEKENEENVPIEIELTSMTPIGELKDRLNMILGKMAGFDKEEIAELPRMALMTGRKIWSDLEALRAVVLEIGCLSSIKYGAIRVTIRSCDLREPPKRSKEEEEETRRIADVKETAARERSRTRRVRPTKLA